MKRVVIVHCWNGSSNYCWYPQVKKELEAEGFSVEVPEMPGSHTPKLSLWLPKLKETVALPDEHVYLIGHSAGCITILRYLEQLDPTQKIGGVVMVAGFTDDLGYEELEDFFEKPIDFEKIKLHTQHFTAIMSDDDAFVPLSYGQILKEKLGAELIVKHAMGHFSGEVGNTQSVTSLPDVTAAIKKML